ncbi:hypothetical protein AB9V60_08880 [Pseudomonas syringae pv. atrofaciens]|uniref:hypothetical protein n=1 Tax=Pseudomonas syringae TaxID=317 RepID=UPI00351F108A
MSNAINGQLGGVDDPNCASFATVIHASANLSQPPEQGITATESGLFAKNAIKAHGASSLQQSGQCSEK